MGAEKNGSRNIMRVLGITAYALTGAAVILWIRRMGVGLIYAYAGLILLFLVRIVDISIHELGHLVGGLMSGYRFVCIQIAGLTVSRAADGRLRIGRMNLPGANGHCLMEPPEIKNGKMPYRMLGAGGILANLIAAAAFGMAAFRADGPTARMLFTVFAIWNAADVLINGIPFRGYVDNDAQNLLEMSRSQEAVRKYRQGMMMSVMKFRGVRIKDMPEEWFYLPTKQYISALGRSPNGLRVQYALAMLVKGHIYKARLLEEEYDEAVRKHPMTRNEEEDKKFFREIREAYERRKMEEGQK